MQCLKQINIWPPFVFHNYHHEHALLFVLPFALMLCKRVTLFNQHVELVKTNLALLWILSVSHDLGLGDLLKVRKIRVEIHWNL